MSRQNQSTLLGLPSAGCRLPLAEIAAKFLLALVLFVPFAANAHTVNTNTLTIMDRDDPDASTSFVVVGHGVGCPTLVSVTVDPEDAVSIDPPSPIEITGSKLFTVTPTSASGEITITVKWAHGESIPDPSDPCYQAMDQGFPDVGTETITLTIEDPVVAFNRTQANLRQAAQANDPVNTDTGELFFTESADLRYHYQQMPLAFQRYYASHLRRWLVVGRMGDNWRHTYEWTLRNVGNTLQIVDNEGRETNYLQPDTVAGDWVQQGNLDVPLDVIQTTDGETIWYVFDPRSGYTYVFSVPGALSEFKLTSIEDGKGNVQNLAYDEDGLLEEVSDLFGRSIQIFYDPTEPNVALKRITSITDGTRTVTFSYDGENLTSVIDADGEETQYLYDTDHPDPGLLERKIWPNGNYLWRQSYDDQGRVETQTDSFGNALSFSYEDINSTRTTVTRPDGLTEIHEHSDAGALTLSTNANGETTSIGNSESTARNQVTSPDGGIFGSTYDAVSGKVSSESFAGGQTTTYDYSTRIDQNGFSHRDLTTVTYPDGSTQTFTYDGDGNRLSHTNQDGYTTTYEYDGFGRMTSATNPLGGETAHTYNAVGNRASTTDPAGNTTTMAYDDFDRIVTVTRADGSTRSFAYDSLDRRTSVTLESGSTTTFSFDANGNLLSVTDPNGNTRANTYDANNNLTSITDRTGNTISYVYDSLSRIIRIDYDDGRQVNFSYRGTNDIDSVTDAEGNSINLAYDSAGRVLSTSDSENNSTTYIRDLQGQITSSITPEGNTTTYEYDPLGRLISVEEPSGRTTTNTFESSGWIRSITLDSGASTLMERNGLGQIERFTSANGGIWTYQYDSSGRVTSVTDPIGNESTHTYNNRNRVSRTDYPGGLGGVDYTYNAFGHITERVWDGGPVINETYDALGRLTATNGIAITYDANSRIVESNGMTIMRDASGRINALTLAPGKTVTYEYNPTSHELASVTDWAGVTTTISNDDRGNISEINRSNNRDTAFAYDSLNRRVLTDHGFTSHEVSRNVDGEVASVQRVQALAADLPGPVSYTYDAADRILEFDYDALGRVINDGTRTYTYDGASRLTRVVSSSDVTYGYNGFGHVVSRTQGGNTREFVWNHADRFPVISIVRDNGVDTRYYVHTPGGHLLYSIDATDNSRLYFHYDERGNTIALSDDAGDIVAMYAYGPFGNMTSTAAVDNPFTFAGLYGAISDPLGFYHIQRRVMDPANGRFLTPEPVMPLLYPQNSIYAYAANDPINNIDPSGTTPSNQELVRQGLTQGTSIAGTVGDGLSGKADKMVKGALIAFEQANSVADTPADINAAFRAITNGEKALDTANDLRRVAKPLQAAGNLGKGFQALDIALTMKKLHDQLGQASEDHDAATRGAVEAYIGRTNTVFQIYRKKNKTFRWLELQLALQKSFLEMDLFNANSLYETELILDVVTAFANGIGSFVPGFTGLDPDAGNNVGFFFF